MSIVLKELKKNSRHIGEIIVVDAMSKDKIGIIAKENNCKIFFQKSKTGYGDAIIKSKPCT